MRVIFLFCLLLGLSGRCQASDETECKLLQSSKRANGLLTANELVSYCRAECTFVKKYKCEEILMNADEPWSFFGVPFADLRTVTFSFVRKVQENHKKGEEFKATFSFRLDAKEYGILLSFFIPYVISAIPIILQWAIIGSHQRGHEVGTRFFLLLFNFFFGLAFIVLRWGHYVEIGYMTVFLYLSSFANVNSNSFRDIVTGYASLLLLAGLSLMNPNWLIQLIGGAAIVIMLGGVFVRSVQSSNDNQRISILISFATFMMAVDYTFVMFDTLAAENPAIALIQLAVFSVVPIGPTHSIFANAINAAANFSTQLDVQNDGVSIGLFMISWTAYIVLFFLSRASVGLMVFSRLQFSWNLNALVHGAYAYVVDIHGPFLAFIQCMFSSDPRSNRRFMYGCLMIFMMSMELMYAQEVLLIRICVWSLDLSVINTGLVNASRLLEADVYLDRVAFPKFGSFPFCSLDTLMSVRRAVYRLEATTSVNGIERTSSGVGTALKAPGTDAQLVTVRHVVSDKHTVQFDDGRCRQSISQIHIRGSSRDPCITMRLDTIPTETADIPFLSLREVRHVNHAFVLSPSGMMSFIEKPSFDRNGDIHINVNLMKGDSGSPIIAIMNDGTSRFAGTVSRGTASEGVPNIASSVATDEGRLTGSPGYENAYLELSGVKTENQWSILSMIEDALSDENEIWREKFSDVLDDYNERKEDGVGFDAYPEGFRKKGKQRIKNYRKDAAVRKRNFMRLIQSAGLSSEDADLLSNDFDTHSVRQFNIVRGNRRRGMEGLGFVRGQQ